MKRLGLIPCAALFALVCAPGRGQADPPSDPLVRAMQDELARSVAQLRLPDTQKPYYLAYRVDDQTNVTVTATFGAVVQKLSGRVRLLHVDARVGDYDHDNTSFAAWPDFGGIEAVPTDDDYDVIRHDLWMATDRAYKQAAATFAKKLASRTTETDSHDHVGDFSHDAPAHVAARHAVTPVDVDQAAALVKGLSLLARNYKDIQSSEVRLRATTGRQTFLSSEGTTADEDTSRVELTATLKTQAADGMPLRRFVSYSARSVAGLPAREVLERDIASAAAELTVERAAEEAEDYVGPVLFEPRAAAQLVKDLLAPELGGTPPPKMGGASSAFRAMMGSESELVGNVDQRVMAPGLRVEDDPTLEQYRGLPLVGGYAADDEGMAGQKVVVIENGVFKRFLMSRAPRKGFEHTNGHAQAPIFGPGTKAAISNLIVSAKHGATSAELKRGLLAEARAEGKKYGVIVRLLDDAMATGDYYAAMTRRSRGGGAVSSPIALVKVTLDGKEHPIRGATFGALPLRTFEDVSMVGADPAVVSDGIGETASVVSPALLIKRVELRKPTGPEREPAAIGHPFFAGASGG